MSTSVQGIPSIEGIVKKLAATEAQVAVALRHALRKTVTWAANQGRSGIAESLNLRLSALKGRVGVYVRSDENLAKSFFGLNDLPSSRLHPRQTPTGATMEGLKGEIKHAFVRSLNGKTFMFLRKQERWVSGPRKGKQKLEQVGLPINDVGQDVIERDVFPKVEARFFFEFERELQRQAVKL